MLKHNFGKENKVTNSLIRRVLKLATTKNETIKFEQIKDFYEVIEILDRS
jgi:hypothetical protein